MAIAGVPLTTNQSCEVLVPQEGEVKGPFLFYLLTFGMFAFHRLAVGTTFDAITRRDIARVRFALPDAGEQAAIARILNSVDTAIEQVEEAILRAESLHRALLEDFFQRMATAPKRLKEFIEDVRYGTSQASSDRGWGNPVLRIPNVVGDQLDIDDLAFVNLRARDVERLRLLDGDLLIVRTNGNPGYVGRSAVFRKPDDRTWVYASYLIRVRLNDDLLPDYVNVFLGTDRGRRELLRRVTTSAGNHNINSNSIRLLMIPVPNDKSKQQEIVDLAIVCRARTRAYEQKLHALNELKKSLMHDLLTGTVRVDPTLFKEEEQA